jgi:hypothetical protein
MILFYDFKIIMFSLFKTLFLLLLPLLPNLF